MWVLIACQQCESDRHHDLYELWLSLTQGEEELEGRRDPKPCIKSLQQFPLRAPRET